MKCLFVNPEKQRCGVHQYGKRLYSIISESSKIEAHYTEGFADSLNFDVIMYNWHPIIDPGHSVLNRLASEMPKAKKVIVYHDGDLDATPLDAVLFSDPSSPATRDKWHHIGRPLPEFSPRLRSRIGDQITVGIHGFCGAWARRVVENVSREFERATVRMLLPPSDHCDPGAGIARGMVAECDQIRGPGIMLEVTHDFMTEHGLLEWLSHNDLNCFIRDPAPSSGISSALDAALAVRRPIAINYHPMFRHVSWCTPSICVEDNSLQTIIENGLSPLVPVYERNSREAVRVEIELVLDCLFLSNRPYGCKA